MLNNDLSKFSYGVTRSVLIYGLHGAGKMTITEYIAHQLRWKIVTFDAIDLIQMEPDKVIYKLEDACEYSISRQEMIILIKNYEEILNIEKTNYQYYIIKKTIVHTIRSIVDKMNDLFNSKVMIICLVNVDTIDTYLNNFILDVFTYVFKQTNPTLDDISMYIVKRIQEHPHDITWKQLLNYAYMIDGISWFRLKRLVNNTFKLPTRDLWHESLFYRDGTAKIRYLNIYDFKNTFNSDAKILGESTINLDNLKHRRSMK